eukprot:UN1914
MSDQRWHTTYWAAAPPMGCRRTTLQLHVFDFMRNQYFHKHLPELFIICCVAVNLHDNSIPAPKINGCMSSCCSKHSLQ